MIDLSKFYNFLFVSVSFKSNLNFVKALKEIYGAEIPYVDLNTLNPELQESLDSYIYLEDNENFVKTYKKLCSKYSKISFTVLGKIRGKNIYKFFNICKEENLQTFRPGDKIRLVSGEFKGLIADIKEIQGEQAVIEFPILKEKKYKTVPLSEVGSFEDSFDLFADQFKDMEANFRNTGSSKILIIDGNDSLHRSIANNNNRYNGHKQYVGAFYGFFFALLKLKEFYPEYTIHVVFEDFENSPLYAKKSQTYRDAFALNFKWATRFVSAIGYHSHYFPKTRSVDVIAGLCKEFEKNTSILETFIFSTNTLLQTLVSKKTIVFFPKVTFRGNASYLSSERILEKWEIDSLEKLKWILAIEGEHGTISINEFLLKKENSKKELAQKARKAEYLPAIQNSKNIEELKITLSKNTKYRDYFKAGIFDAGLNVLEFKTLPTGLNFDKKERNEKEALKILEETQMYKEIEYWDRSYRMFRGLW